jgi:hypothetical protein
MRKSFLLLFTIISFVSCNNRQNTSESENDSSLLAQDVLAETRRTWEAYKKYAWGHDVLKPISRSYHDWYDESLYISPIDAYSTLKLMGMEKEAAEIEAYVIDSVSFDKDIFVKVFEVNIRILGGLLSMYELSGNPAILDKARDFADRMLPAFNSKTGIPAYWVNLRSGETRGDTVNVAEAGTYTFEMGILSYYTSDPKYYQAGKKATKAIFDRRSEIGLIGDIIDIQTGKWVSESSHICAGVDSYYEYMFKSYLMFGDPEMKRIWDKSIEAVHQYIAEEFDKKLWYGRSNMYTGKNNSSVITLYDAFFPAILALSGDTDHARKLQSTWDWVWNRYGLEPTVYDYKKDTTTYPVYNLNPEIIESAYYLYHFTGDSLYMNMARQYWTDIKKYCKTEIAFTSVENVMTKEKGDYMATYFLAETLKYFYLLFSYEEGTFDFNDHIFNTEAHPFKRSLVEHSEASVRLGFKLE